MANIHLTDEAYARLKAAKKEDQSFSDFVMETVQPRGNLDEFFGSCKGMDLEKALNEVRKDRRKS